MSKKQPKAPETPTAAAPQPEAPTVVSLSVVRHEGFWSVLTLTTKGDKILSQTFSVPDTKLRADTLFKVEALKHFLGAAR